MNLIVVESPTKARTLSRFLGKEFHLEATMGHIKDLPKSKLGVDVEKNFAPDYVVVTTKSKSIKRIKEIAKKAKKIYLATDPDREGEAIAQHVYDVLRSNDQFPISNDQLKRIIFHEITNEAVQRAIDNPKDIDKNLVDAQIARRVLDRLVGYKLSPLLWKKVRRGLSAGRVQSVAVRLIVEREREIEAFVPAEYWDIFCKVRGVKPKAKVFIVRLVKIEDEKAEIGDGKLARQVVSDLEIASYRVHDVKTKEVKENPYPPFTTSTMTQSAARLFAWSAKRTMSVAQRLYEQGLITYHRTDSTNIAKAAVDKVRSYVKKEFGDEYLPTKPRVYKTRAKVAQEAHEAIRPTNVNTKYEIRDTKYGRDAKILYDLIWKRFVTCQMKEALYNETKIEVKAAGEKNYLLQVSGRVLKFDGWRRLIRSRRDRSQAALPEVSRGEELQLIKVDPQQKFTEPPPRYNEASLIKILEKLGIGRPSTYAPTISTIQVRNYVEKRERRFHPTPVGIAVNDFLIKNFPDVFEYSFTAEMENSLDKVANGKEKWVDIIRGFWHPFAGKLESVEEKSKRVKIEAEKLGKKCPKCKKGELVIRIGKFGKFVSCSRFPECKHTEKYMEKIGMKCLDCGKGDVIVKTTRGGKRFYGCSRFPKCKWASWRKPKVSKPKN